MKYIIIVPDGMADQPLEELNNKTPLEVANTPNMDYLACHGLSGEIQTIPDGMAPGSDVGNMSLMGYDPKKYLTGRAPFEAASLGITQTETQITVRCNLVTVENNKMIDYSAGHITTKEATTLINDLNNFFDLNGIELFPGKSYRHILRMDVPIPKNYMQIKATPPHDIMGKNITKYLPQGKDAVMFLKLMERSREFLENHPINQVRLDLGENPANMIWLWGQGTLPQIPSYQELYGLKGGVISAVDLVQGIGKLAGLEIIDVPGITGYYDTNYAGKAQYALNYLKNNDFIFIHIEAPDEAGHNADIKAKIEAIERIDKDILGPIINRYGKHDESRILVLPDHPTPIALRTHTSDPVPFVLFGKGIDHNGANALSEKAAKEQGVIFDNGEELIAYFINKYLD